MAARVELPREGARRERDEGAAEARSSPARAVVERGGAKVVFVVEDGKVRMVPVTLGAPFGGGFELTDGPDARHARREGPAGRRSRDGQAVKEKEWRWSERRAEAAASSPKETESTGNADERSIELRGVGKTLLARRARACACSTGSTSTCPRARSRR